MLPFYADSRSFPVVLTEWFALHHIELLATILGLIYIVYSVRENRLSWVFGFITSALYVYVYYHARIYADMGINVYYVLVSIYGWIHWSGKRTNGHKAVRVTRAGLSSGLILLLVTLVLFVFIAFVLVRFTDSDIAYWDAFTTAASITATWMLARKILEHWIVWVVVDAVSAGLYIVKGLYPTTVLFAVYTILAVSGYIEWKRSWKLEQQTDVSS